MAGHGDCTAHARCGWGLTGEKHRKRKFLPYCMNLATSWIFSRRMKETRMASRFRIQMRFCASAARKSHPKSGETPCQPCVKGDGSIRAAILVLRVLLPSRTGWSSLFPVELRRGEIYSDSPALERKKSELRLETIWGSATLPGQPSPIGTSDRNKDIVPCGCLFPLTG
jgi:hypothetical protein